MKKLKLYLDTSVISHLDAPDAYERMTDTIVFWEEIKAGKYEVVISELTFKEIAHCFEPKRTFLNNELNKIETTLVTRTEDVSELAKNYVKGGVLSQKSYDMSSHTGNVLAVVTDKRLANNQPDVVAVYDYYPYGQYLPNRTSYDPANDYRYGFQNHEKVFEIHGGWYGFGEYGYDAMLGTRPTPDPKWQNYPERSPYSVFNNNPIRFIDPDGQAPGDPFETEITAANDFAEYYNGTSIIRNKEFGSAIYQNDDGTYSYNEAYIGSSGSTKINRDIPEDATRVSAIHTHGGDDPRYGDNSYNFSPNDKRGADRRGQNEYLVTPAGRLLEYDVSDGNVYIPEGASNYIPSDPDSGRRRVNRVPARDTNPRYIVPPRNR